MKNKKRLRIIHLAGRRREEAKPRQPVERGYYCGRSKIQTRNLKSLEVKSLERQKKMGLLKIIPHVHKG